MAAAIKMKSNSSPYQRQPPFGKLSPRKEYWVELSNIHPSIRIAHQGSLANIDERIIFDYEIVLFLTGQGRVTIQSQTIDFQAGHLFLFCPFVPHAIEVDASEPCEHLAIHFDVTQGVPLADDCLEERGPYEVRLSHGLAWPTHLVLPSSHSIESMLRRVIQMHNAPEPIARLSSLTYLSQVLIEMFTLEAHRDVGHKDATFSQAVCRIKFERSIRYVQQHLASDITVDDLADAAELSASYITRLFKQWVGTTPMNYLRQVRVERARQLLADVDLSIQQVGAQVGLRDPYHFSKVFRRIDGLSPSAFRQMLLAGRKT
ncbi:MAG: AraC family transcriptional regulator [Phycisphaeraceae bacterium]|nr:AraC family transcriptional regulator [Phycisphaeraceae bacterium]